MKLSLNGIQDRAAWERAGIALPEYDVRAMREKTKENPVWVHFGAGNIFRGFIAALQQRLLNAGESTRGITAAEAAVMLGSFLEPSPAALTRSDVPDWACAAVASLTSCGVFPDGADTAAPITRAEAAQMLLGAYELLQKR